MTPRRRRAWPRWPGGWGPSGRLVVHGDGSTSCRSTGAASILDVTPAGIERRAIDRAALLGLGLVPGPSAELAGGIAGGERRASSRRSSAARRGPHRDVTVLNAAAGVRRGAVGWPRSGRAPTWPAATIDAGLATALLERLRAEREAAEAAAATAEGAPA